MKNIGIVGAGVMGRQLSEVLRGVGFTVDLIGAREFSLLTKTSARQRTSLWDLALECVREDAPTKNSILFALSESSSTMTIASNTSSLRIEELSLSVSDPERFLGLHFFNPLLGSLYVEIIVGTSTREGVLEGCRGVLSKIGLDPVMAPDKPGFTVNRVLFPMLNSAVESFEVSGLTPKKFDSLMKAACGLKLGPLATLDLIGLDVSLSIISNLRQSAPRFNPPPASLLSKMVEEGRLGRKSKLGFHTYF